MMRNLSVVAFLAVIALFLMSASKGPFKLMSPAVKGKPQIGFDSGLKSDGRIAAIYAAKDKGKANPRLFPFTWKNLPAGTKALALVFDDPDAKKVMAANGMKGDSFIHWIAADINPSLGGLKDNASAHPRGFIQGKNGRGEIGYTGPQPPKDFPKDAKRPIIHVYRLQVYALSAPSGLKDGFTLDEMMAAINDKIIGAAELNMSFNN